MSYTVSEPTIYSLSRFPILFCVVCVRCQNASKLHAGLMVGVYNLLRICTLLRTSVQMKLERVKLERVKIERVNARRKKADAQRYAIHRPLFAGMYESLSAYSLASEMLPCSVRQSANVRR